MLAAVLVTQGMASERIAAWFVGREKYFVA